VSTQVIDTNVIVTADGRSDADADCVARAASRLSDLANRGEAVIDDGFRILKEYLANRASYGEAPGAGSEFLQWLLVNQATERCTQVHLTETAPDEFTEFPDDPDLATFDRSDRKFAAAARVAGAPVVNATDPDWAEHAPALSRNGIQVDELCRD
jgi:hypothetical protein